MQRNQPRRSDFSYDNEWTSGICDCFTDCGPCCFAFWCLPCFLCSLDGAARECCCTTVGICALSGFHPTIGLTALRSKIRGTFGIKGSIFGDCCCSAFCCCCSSLQMYRELKYRGEII